MEDSLKVNSRRKRRRSFDSNESSQKRRLVPDFCNDDLRSSPVSSPRTPGHIQPKLSMPHESLSADYSSSEDAAEALLGLSTQAIRRPAARLARLGKSQQRQDHGGTWSNDSDAESDKAEASSHKTDTKVSKKDISKRNSRSCCPDIRAHRCKCGKHISKDHPACKSELMLLGERFRDFYNAEASKSTEPVIIDLVETVKLLSAERRRLYDITIVYEAAEVIKKTRTLTYEWCGSAHLPALIDELRRQEEMQEPVGEQLSEDTSCKQNNSSFGLYYMSRKLMRHLITQEGPVLLTDAATYIMDSMKSQKKTRSQSTVERRLYDIGSILETLDLIKRLYVDGRRQPSFQWNLKTPSNPPAANSQCSSEIDSQMLDLTSPKCSGLQATKSFRDVPITEASHSKMDWSSGFYKCQMPSVPSGDVSAEVDGQKVAHELSDSSTKTRFSTASILGPHLTSYLDLNSSPSISSSKAVLMPTQASLMTSLAESPYSSGLGVFNTRVSTHLSLPSDFPPLRVSLLKSQIPSFQDSFGNKMLDAGANIHSEVTLCKPQPVRAVSINLPSFTGHLNFACQPSHAKPLA